MLFVWRVNSRYSDLVDGLLTGKAKSEVLASDCRAFVLGYIEDVSRWHVTPKVIPCFPERFWFCDARTLVHVSGRAFLSVPGRCPVI